VRVSLNPAHFCPETDASGPVIIRSVGLKHAAPVRVAENYEVVHRFAPGRSDEPFEVAVLPRGARRSRMIAGPHCTNAMGIR
jgi:hypothetical protein